MRKIFFAWLGLVLAAGFIACGVFESRWVRVSAIALDSADLPEKFIGRKIVFASDFHCGIFFTPDRMADAVERINRLNPDIVVLGGDYVDYDQRYIEPCIRELKNIHSKLGVYGVLGNHDYLAGESAVRKALAGSSVVVLNNDSRWIDDGGQRIKLGGVSDFLRSKADLSETAKDIGSGDFVILAVHNPTYMDRIGEAKIDLVLSGHTHGGQITFFGLWFPFFDLVYGHKYRTGLYVVGDKTLLVSNGLGTTSLPLRFFARPEINVITLEKRQR